MRRHAAVVVLTTVAACSAYHSASPPAMGAQGGSCYPNGTCNAGLVCASDVCSPPGEVPPGSAPPGTPPGTPPGMDGGTNVPPNGDSGADGSAKKCAVDPPSPVAAVPCLPTACSDAAAPACCGSSASDLACHAKTDAACQSVYFHYECLSGAQCSSQAPFCCATLSFSPDACPRQAVASNSICTNDSTCGALVRLCDADPKGGCQAGKTCNGVDATISSMAGSLRIGVCDPTN